MTYLCDSFWKTPATLIINGMRKTRLLHYIMQEEKEEEAI